MKCFTVFDRKGGEFGPLVTFISELSCLRFYTTEVREGNGLLSRFPQDFAIYYVGDWDVHKGVITANPAPVHIVECVNLLAKGEGNDGSV